MLSFVHRLAAQATGGFRDSLDVLYYLAAREANDENVCSAEDYNKYVLKLLGKYGTAARRSRPRQVIVHQLREYRDEMRYGGARAACGADASPADLRNFRRRVRAATFPRGILEARSPEDAYRWASSKFGGGFLPPIDSARGKKLMKKFRKVRALSKKGLL